MEGCFHLIFFLSVLGIVQMIAQNEIRKMSPGVRYSVFLSYVYTQFFYHRQCKLCISACKCWLIAYFDCVALILFCCIKNIKGYHVSSHKIQKVDTENIVSAEELFRAYTACSALPHFWDSASQYWSSVCSIGYKQYGVNWLFSLIWYIFFEKNNSNSVHLYFI